MKLQIALAAAAVFAVSASGAHANYITNGGFEYDSALLAGSATPGYYNLGTDVGAQNAVPADFGWTVTGDVDLISHTSFGGSFSNAGAAGLDLVGYGDGTSPVDTISQTFNLTSPGTYAVAFQYKSPNTAGAGATVTVNGTSFSVTGTGTDQFFYQTFTSTGGPTTLSIASTGGANNSGLYLDNVQVTAAPEPGVWALMIAGLAMMGGALRLRRRQTGAVAA